MKPESTKDQQHSQSLDQKTTSGKIKHGINTILLGITLAVAIFVAGYKIGQFFPTSSATSSLKILDPSILKNDEFDAKLYNQVVDELNAKYVDKEKIDAKSQFYGALKGIVASVGDPYTFFLTPEENEQSKDDLGGRFEGIGAQLGLKNNAIVIIAPLKNSPAAQAGVRAGDYIAKVDGEETKGWTLQQAVGKIRGEKGTPVILTLLREPDQELDAEIIRDRIEVEQVETSTETDPECDSGSSCSKVAVIKVNQFGDKTDSEWDKAVSDTAKRYQNGEIKGLIVDMRGNPGGFLDSAVYLSSEFIPQGSLVVRQESTVTGDREYTAGRVGNLPKIPLVVMIDQGSASAAEIFAGAMRDYDRATLVGQKSFGKGSVQEALDLKGNAGLHVTIAKWILPKGEWINGKGIKPEIEVENTPDGENTITKETDEQLKKALSTLLEKAR